MSQEQWTQTVLQEEQIEFEKLKKLKLELEYGEWLLDSMKEEIEELRYKIAKKERELNICH